MAKDLGDFQTPPALVTAVLECLARTGKIWSRVLEPTCGYGNFIRGLLRLEIPPQEIQGIEIQGGYVEAARSLTHGQTSTRVVIRRANLFELNLHRDLSWKDTGPLLVIGNLPWITNSELGAIGSNNLPQKTNFRGLKGIDALTGSSNFDIAEYIWIKLIRELAGDHPTIALLCKTSVARNILQFSSEHRVPMRHAWIRRVDAQRTFGASVDACLFCVEIGPGETRYEAEVYPDLTSSEPELRIGVVGRNLVADVEAYQYCAFADGHCPVIWRQGLKHDAAAVMELTGEDGWLYNKLGEPVVIEPDYIYRLLKGSDVFKGDVSRPTRSIIVTQSHLGEDTSQLQSKAPQLWRYLTSHQATFERRKSSIYRGQPPFCLFGIGDYSFAAYKVTISGLHKSPRFRAIGPVNGRPVMLDDTCYFIACRSPEQAALLTSLLNDQSCLRLIHSLAFWDSKRPITKKLLQRIDLFALLARADRELFLRNADRELLQLRGPHHQLRAEWPSSVEQLVAGEESVTVPVRQLGLPL